MRIAENVEEYICRYPEHVQAKLQQIRALVFELVPDAEESIAYGMPTFKKNGLLTHFAAYKYHVGLYPGPEALAAFKADISKYKNAKGSVQFPLNELLPVDLIKRIVEYRIQVNNQNLGAVKDKRAKKTPAKNQG